MRVYYKWSTGQEGCTNISLYNNSREVPSRGAQVPGDFHRQLNGDGARIPAIVLQHPKKGWHPRTDETKQWKARALPILSQRWTGPTFVCPYNSHSICLNNFIHNLSTALMAQACEGLNDLFTKAHYMEVHLNRIRTRNSITMTVAPKERSTCAIGLSTSKKASPTKPKRPEMMP